MRHLHRTRVRPASAERDMAGAGMLEGGWYSTEEVAELLGVDPSTLRRWRTGRPVQGPPFVPLSARTTVYSVADVEAWLIGRRVDPQVAA